MTKAPIPGSLTIYVRYHVCSQRLAACGDAKNAGVWKCGDLRQVLTGSLSAIHSFMGPTSQHCMIHSILA